MEEKLKKIVERIEASGFSDEQKAELYETISAGLQATVWPTLVKYMPQEQLEYLAADPKGRVTVESYTKLISESVKDGQALTEMEGAMDGVLNEVSGALDEQGV